MKINWTHLDVCFGVIFVLVTTCTAISYSETSAENRSFVIDYKQNTFLKDGKPFRYIAGSIHYFRIHPYYWRDRLEKMYAAGLNAVTVYVSWFLHEPLPGRYNFSGILDLEGFLKTAHAVGLLVVLRPGPYICAAVDFGGLPAWLMWNKQILLRTMDSKYIAAVDRYLNVLLPKVKPYLYENGGPIITVQVENEYGSYFACDYDYTRYLRRKFRQLLSDTVVLFTTDGYSSGYLKCGPLDGLYSSIDGPLTVFPEIIFEPVKKIQPNGPLVWSEFYPGSDDFWKSAHHTHTAKEVSASLDAILAYGVNLNVYMFQGSTNFGYTNGALGYNSIITSYDYDAPISESGDLTWKYFSMRKVISKYNKPHTPVPSNTTKYAYGAISMEYGGTIQDALNSVCQEGPQKSKYPLSMEDMKQFYGFILYRFTTVKDYINTLLNFTTVRDRIYVMLDGFVVGKLTQTNVQMYLTIKAGQVVDLLIENMGRTYYGNDISHNRKGLITNVTLNGSVIEDWLIFTLDLGQYPMDKPLTSNRNKVQRTASWMSVRSETPSFYTGHFVVPDSGDHPMDTYVNTMDWTKGQIFINGFNLGRYWPYAGPQVTLFLPKSILKPYPLKNSILIFELEKSPCSSGRCEISFIDFPLLNATPHNVNSTHKPFDFNLYKFSKH